MCFGICPYRGPVPSKVRQIAQKKKEKEKGWGRENKFMFSFSNVSFGRRRTCPDLVLNLKDAAWPGRAGRKNE